MSDVELRNEQGLPAKDAETAHVNRAKMTLDTLSACILFIEEFSTRNNHQSMLAVGCFCSRLSFGVTIDDEAGSDSCKFAMPIHTDCFTSSKP